MNIILFLVDFILHLDIYLGQIISTYGVGTYAILFTTIFVETGIVFAPFLPGDSLLFTAGAFSAIGSLNLATLLILLITAAILGDTANYWIGYFIGKKIVAHPKLLIRKDHLDRTNAFFAKHGGETIILARFIPFVRTLAPFVAGMGRMNYGKFIAYNVIGGILWVTLCTMAGYLFGNIPFIKHNFSLVIIGVSYLFTTHCF